VDRNNHGIDILMDERETLQRSNAKAQESVETGRTILESLQMQSERLSVLNG
jgi:hypothetical protein